MTERIASCSCGQLTARVTGEPVRISVCHCLACQRRTGSVFGMQARFRSEDVRLQGESVTYVRVPDEGGEVIFRFCPRCGATIAYEIDEVEGFTAIPVGAFADPSFPPPRVSVYEERTHPWVGLPANVEHET